MNFSSELHKAFIKRDLVKMKELLTVDSSYINQSYKNIQNTTIFDNSLYFGWLPESQLLHSFGAKTLNQSPLENSVFSQNLELVKWVYQNVDNNIENISESLCEKSMAKNHVSEETKYKMVSFLLDIGIKNTDIFAYYAYALNLRTIVQLLYDRNLVNMDVIVDLPNRTLKEFLELRKIEI
jgi:hypothetical protein